MIVKSLRRGDERVGEEAKVERGVLFITHLRSTFTVWLRYCLFEYALNGRRKANVPRYHVPLFFFFFFNAFQPVKYKWEC